MIETSSDRSSGLSNAAETLRASFPASGQLDAIEFELPGGSCTVLTGPSGIGKTTLLRKVADLDMHDGKVFLGSVSQADIPAPDWRRNVMYLASEAGWWAPRVRDHFAVTGEVLAMLEKFGIKAEKLDMLPGLLSSGERQRMALVRALSYRPKFLLLDEPTSALDHETVLKVEDILTETKHASCGLLIVSHDAAQVERLADAQISMRARS